MATCLCLLCTVSSILEDLTCMALPAEEFKRLKMMICGGKGGGGMMKNMPKNLQKGMAGMNPHNMQMNMAQMSRMLPPHVLKQMGGTAGLQGLMRQMEGK